MTASLENPRPKGSLDPHEARLRLTALYDLRSRRLHDFDHKSDYYRLYHWMKQKKSPLLEYGYTVSGMIADIVQQLSIESELRLTEQTEQALWSAQSDLLDARDEIIDQWLEEYYGQNDE